MAEKQLKVLISAYACNPGFDAKLHPGEDAVGWNLVKELSKFAKLWVITEEYNKIHHKEIPSNVQFIYVRLPLLYKILYPIDFARRIYYYLWQWKAYFVGRELHEKINFDLVHHLTFGNDWMPDLLGAFLGLPFVWGPIGGGQRTPKPLLREYTLVGKLKEFFRLAAQWIGRNLLITRKLTMLKASKILVCNRETYEMFPSRVRHKIEYFPVNGISEEELRYIDTLNGERDKFIIVTAGRLHRLKGFSLLIRSFKAFIDKANVSDVVLEIIGDGEERENLERLVSRLKIGDKVIFTGWASREDVLKKFKEASIFSFLSFRDGGGFVVIEAMAAGCPCVVLDSGGPGFHVKPEWGFLIKPSIPEKVVEETANAFWKLYSDANLRFRLGRNARKRVEDYYLWSKLAQRMYGIYKEVVMK